MKTIFFVFGLIFLFMSCSDKEDHEISYSNYHISIVGDTLSNFEGVKNSKTFQVYVTKEKYIDGLPTKEIVNVSTNLINIQIEGTQFNLEDVSLPLFTILAKDNLSDSEQEGILTIYVKENGVVAEKKIILRQDVAFSTEYQISSDYTSPFTIPKEGGTFFIPFKCYNRMVSKNNTTEWQKAELNGLGYSYGCVNAADTHVLEISKDGKEIGDYKLILKASPYYFENSETKFDWFFSILNPISKQEYFKIHILHEQDLSIKEEQLPSLSSQRVNDIFSGL